MKREGEVSLSLLVWKALKPTQRLMDPEHLVSKAAERALLMIEASRKPTDPVEKEMRQFYVRVDETVLDRLYIIERNRHSYIDLKLRKIVYTKKRKLDVVPASSRGCSTQWLFNQIRKRLWYWCELGYFQPISVTISRRVQSLCFGVVGTIPTTEFLRRAMRLHWRQGPDVPSLRAVHETMVTMIPLNFCPPFVRSNIHLQMRTLSQILVKNGTEYLHEMPGLSEFMKRNNSDPSLILKFKYYITRGDNRAYLADHLGYRSLVSAILEAILRAMDSDRCLRHQMWDSSMECIWPAKDSTRLDWKIQIRPELIIKWIFLDISSFTSSCPSWLLTLVLYLEAMEADSSDGLKKPFVIEVCGWLMETTAIEVLELYLACTMGVPAKVEEDGTIFHLQGGFLGVGGNMTLTRLYTALVLRDVVELCKPIVHDMGIQAGGDDTAIWFQGTEDQVELAESLLLTRVREVIGFIKEWNVIVFEKGRFRGDKSTSVFCKHTVTCELGEGHIRTRTGFNPGVTRVELVAAQAVKQGGPSYEKLILNAVQTWKTDSLKAVDPSKYLSLRVYAAMKAGIPVPSSVPLCAPSLGTKAGGAVIRGDVLLLPRAHALATQVDERTTSYGVVLRQSLKQKSYALLKREAILLIKEVVCGGRSYTVFATKSERGRIKKLNRPLTLRLFPLQSEAADELADMLLAARSVFVIES